MTHVLVRDEASLDLPLPALSDDEFFELCVRNPEYRIERTAKGDIVVMSGTGGRTGNQNIELSMQLQAWAKKDKRGVAFDSSTMFRLPSGAMRSPDAAWVSRVRLELLAEDQKWKYIPLCPDFVVELTSPTDRLPAVQRKMEEWLESGCHLGWILHPLKREVHVYRPSGCQILQAPLSVLGESPIDGFLLQLEDIWNPGW